jgi:hypothetical protein
LVPKSVMQRLRGGSRKQRHGNYCGPLARSGKFGKSEDSERSLEQPQAMPGMG